MKKIKLKKLKHSVIYFLELDNRICPLFRNKKYILKYYEDIKLTSSKDISEKQSIEIHYFRLFKKLSKKSEILKGLKHSLNKD